MTHYNRPRYTRQIVKALSRCTGIGRYTIVACVEPDNDEVLAHVEAIDFAERVVVRNKKRLGCTVNTYRAMSIGFTLADYVIHVEDDVLLARDALVFHEFCRSRYRDDQGVLSVTGYHRAAHCNPASYHEVRRRRWFHPWNCAFWKDRWDLLAPGWLRPRRVLWDGYVHSVLKHLGCCELHPMLSRAQNIGAERGTCVPSARWHRANQHVPFWAEDAALAPGEFWEKQ